MRTIKLTIAYDGTHYAGWQLQPDRPTVQGAIESALEQIVGQHVRVAGSGRTDAGVHALGQVASFDTTPRLSADVLRRALNARLPHDIAVREAVDAPPGFHATADAIRKRYRYMIHDGPIRDVFGRRYCWHVYQRLDAERMHRAAQACMGTHDFASFENRGSPRESSVRTIFDVAVHRGGGDGTNRVVIEVEADGFLYNMVRNIVGTLVEVGRHARSEAWVGEALAACDRSAAGPTAPPEGLFLLRVEYDLPDHRDATFVDPAP